MVLLSLIAFGLSFETAAAAPAEQLQGLWQQTMVAPPGGPTRDPITDASRFYYRFGAAGAMQSVVQIGLQNFSTPGTYQTGPGNTIHLSLGDEDEIDGTYALSPGRLSICPSADEDDATRDCFELTRPNPAPDLRTGAHAVPRVRGRLVLTVGGAAAGQCEFNSSARPAESPYPARYDQPMGTWSCVLPESQGRTFSFTMTAFQMRDPDGATASYVGQIQVMLAETGAFPREVFKSEGFEMDTRGRQFQFAVSPTLRASLAFSAQNL